MGKRTFPLVKVEGFKEMAEELYNLTEVKKDSFSPKILTNPRQSHQMAAYGGLIFSQALAAAQKTVTAKLAPHSVHSYFILNVDTREPLTYDVRRVRDGRSFATRVVDAVQNDKIVFTLQASFHKEEMDYISHQKPMPKVPPPEELIGMRQAVPIVKELVVRDKIKLSQAMHNRLQKVDSVIYSAETDLWEMRPTDIAMYYGLKKDKKPHLSYWMRTRGDLPNDINLHRNLISYITDAVPGSTAITPHNAGHFVSSMMFSLDHCVWFHKADGFRADEWLLYEAVSNRAGGGRAFVDGKVYKRDGTLILSCHQELLIRSRDLPPSKI